MSSGPDELRGRQEPRVSSVPPFRTSAGPDVVEYAASVGLVMDPWQALVLEGALAESGSVWAALEVGLVVGRQNGKGAILEARELGGIFLFGERLIVHTAHELKTANEAQLRMDEIIESSPELDRQCMGSIKSNGKEHIRFRNGARIKYIARSRGSGRGFTGDCVVFDEAMFLDATAMDSLMPTLSARPNPQLWYTGSAGFPDSSQMIRVRERALAGGDPSLAYFEWSATEDADLDDREAWEQANPALGIRLSERFMRSERAALTEVGFARERLGIWDTGRHDAVIPVAVWAECCDTASKPVDPIAFALDVTPDRRFGSICAVGRRDDGRLHGELVDNREGTGWMADRLVELVERWDPCAVALDPAGPVGSLLPDLAERDIEVMSITGRELAQACGGFYDDVVQDRWRHSGQVQLASALGAARKRPLGDAWAWHRKDQTDISPLVAVTVARFAFLTAEPPAGPSAYEDRGLVTL